MAFATVLEETANILLQGIAHWASCPKSPPECRECEFVENALKGVQDLVFYSVRYESGLSKSQIRALRDRIRDIP